MVNGGLRPILERWCPREYVGVDITGGPGVDLICDVCDLVHTFGPRCFDIVISTEVLEHVRDWRGAVSNLKAVCRPHGLLVLTTRSKGFPYHAWPHDYWRYELDDFRHIFSDCEALVLESDTASPGVFLKARVPAQFEEVDLSSHELYSVALEGRVRKVSDAAADRHARGIVRFRKLEGFWDSVARLGKWYSRRTASRASCCG